MGLFDAIFPGVAQTVIGVLGDAARIVEDDGAYDARTGQRTATGVTYSVLAAPPRAFGLSQVNGTTILQGDVSVTIAAKGLAVEPSPGKHTLVLPDGTALKIVSVNKVMSGAASVVYELQCRK